MIEPHAQPRPFRRVPRWVWFVVMCIALGAITSVGVAWGIAWENDSPRGNASRCSVLQIEETLVEFDREVPIMWGITDRVDRGRSITLVEVLYARMFDNVTAERLHDSARLSGEVQRAIKRHVPLLRTPEAPLICFSVYRWGWPLRCLALEKACTSQSANRFPQTEFANLSMDVSWFSTPQWPVTNPMFNLRSHYGALQIGDKNFPCFPLWPGLLANTAIYGGVWAVLIGVPVLLRRWLRARRGGCPQCGYSREGLKVDAPCPECGRTPRVVVE